jgi:WD40 repeat protein
MDGGARMPLCHCHCARAKAVRRWCAQDPERKDDEKGKGRRPWDEDEDDGKAVFGPGTEKTTFHGACVRVGTLSLSLFSLCFSVQVLCAKLRMGHAGKAERDYLGRTYMSVPTDVDVNLGGEPGAQECFIPKRLIHTWTGHTKAVSAIRFFPQSAHLLLSCSMDGKVKLWDVYHARSVLRTYIGHSKGVRDICFTNDGARFLSASFDKTIKLWDTETGVRPPVSRAHT